MLSSLERSHDGVVRCVKMFGGVLVFRGIAAAHVSARQAHAQVDPGVAGFQAFLAAARMRLHVVDLAQVSASCHKISGSFRG
jgi:hypothetical protein